MQALRPRSRLLRRNALALLLVPLFAGLGPVRADPLPDLDLGGATLAPVFAPETVDYTTAVPALQGGLALYPRLGSAGQILQVRDAEGRFRRVSPGATLAAGRQHFLALRDDGAVVAWGPASQDETTVPVAAQSGVVAVAAGHMFSLALKTDGSVVAWGQYVGDTSSPLNVPVAAQSGVVAISGGSSHALALKTDGSVVAWGSIATPPSSVSSGVVAIASGANHALALKSDGSVVSWGSADTPPAGAQSGVVAIAAQANYSVAVKADGSLVCWGTPPPSAGFPLADAAPIVGVAAATNHLATLRADGSVQVWTSDNYSALRAIPDAARGAVALAVGDNVAAALTPDGRVVTWGSSGNAGLVVPATAARLRLPASARLALPAGSTALELRLAASGDVSPAREPLHASSHGAAVVLDPTGAPLVHGVTLNLPASATGLVAMRDGLGLKADGSLVAWRWSLNSGAEESVPLEIAAEPAAAIAAFASQRFVLSRTGVVRGWSTSGSSSALLSVPTAAQSGVASVDTGGYHQLALKVDGSVVAWGDNAFGKTTVPSAAQTGVVAIAAGRFHSVALRADRTLVFWGKRYTDTGAPAYEYRLSKPVAKLVAGEDTTAILFADGELAVFGDISPTHVTLAGGQPAAARSGVADVAFGYSHVSVLKTDGTLLSWGSLSGTHATGLASLRAGPAGDALRITATRPTPNPALTTLRSSGGEFSPALGADTLHLAQSLPASARGITLQASGAETRAGLEVSVNGDPARRLAGGASLASGNNFNLGLTPQGKVLAWGSSTMATATPADLTDVVSVAAGGSHALALRADGSLRVWSSASGSPVFSVPASARYDVAAIAAYGDNSAVLKRNGTPVIWSPSGNLNNIPVAASANVTAIALGAYHALALKTDGSVVAWGSIPASPPSSVSSGVVAIASGDYFSLALKADGSVVSWGSTSYGLNIVPAAIGNKAVAIAAGRSQALALLSDGSVVWWGDTGYGAMPASATSGVIAISAGNSHASVLKADGSVVTWGSFPTQSSYADIRLIPPANALLPVRSGTNLIAIRSVAADGAPLAATPLVAGRERNWFLRADGALDSGIVNLTTGYPTPPTAADRVDVAAVATGIYGEYAIRFDGTLRTLRGATPPGELTSTSGGSTRPRALRVAVAQYFAVALLEDRTLRIWRSSGTTLPAELAGEFVSIAAGYSHLIALRADGRVVIWGEVNPAASAAPSFALQAVAAGGSFNLGLKPDGTLAAWGDKPAVIGAVPAGNDFVAIAAGDAHAVALRADGSVVAWGDNISGQTVVPALAQSGVVAISAAASHTLALRADGRVVAWGNNAFSPGFVGFAPGARRDYRLAVTRAPANPALADLSTHLGAPTPAFAPATLAYAQSAPADLAALRLSARAVDPGQLQMRVNGRPFERVATGASLAAGNGFVVGIDPRGGAAVLSGTSSSFTTIPAAAQSDLVAIAAGYSHILALRADGATVAWGTASQNTLGIPSAASADVAAIAANYNNSLALRRDGQVVGWGANSTLAAVPAGLGSDNRAIALGYFHALVLKNDGSVVQWGNSSALPAEVASGVVAIAAGFDYSLALKADGTLVAWGTKTTMSVPPEAARADVVAISAAPLTAMVIKRDGTRIVWSHLNAPSLTPPALPGEMIEVVGNESGGAGLFADGRVGMWGNYSPNYFVVTRPIIRPISAPLSLSEGTNRIDLRVAPAPGRPLLDASFSAGTYHNLVVTAAGSVRIGKVADSSPAPNTSLPTAAQSDVIGVFSRDTRNIVLRADGRVVALPGGSVPLELQPGYTYGSPPAPARAVALALGSSDTLTLRADGSVFAWQNDSAVPADARAAVASIAASPGSDFFAVRTDGRLVKWNSSGAVDANLPAATKTGVAAAAPSMFHGLVLKADGTLIAWRYNDPASSDAMTAIPSGATDIVAIAAADRHFLALRRDGVIFSWGQESMLNTVPAAAQSGIVAITAGPRHALALRADGVFVPWGGSVAGEAVVVPSSEGLLSEPIRTYSLAVDRALGAPDFGALRAALGELSPAFASGVGSFSLPATPYRSTTFHGRPTTPLGPVEIRVNGGAPSVRLPGATVATSDQAVIALRPDGTVQAFGSGLVATVAPAARQEVVAVSAGREHAVALKRDGSLVAWGSNTQQQAAAPAGNHFVAVAAGDYHTLALTSSGLVVGWGSSLDQKLVPQTGATFVAIAAGERTSMALRADGSVVAWGKGTPTPQTVPTDAQSGVVAVAAGRNHYLALRSDGRVVEWGGDLQPPMSPTHGIVAISAAGDRNFALRSDGVVLMWDSGFSDPTPIILPSALSENVSAFTLGRRNGALLRADGSLWVASYSGASLVAANGTSAYAGPFALPVSARVSLALGGNTVNLRLARFDAALPPVSYSVALDRSPAPEARILAGDGSGDPSWLYYHDFGKIPVGGSANQSFTLHNPGTADLLVSGHQWTGTGATSFQAGGLNGPLSVPPGGFHTFTITASPTQAGLRFAWLMPSLNLPNGEEIGFTARATGFTHASETTAWRAANFTAEERADPALEATVWGDQADPDGDGLPNLLEYALGLAPRAAGASPVTVTHENDPETGPVLKFSYTRPKSAAAAGLVYRVVASDTLAPASWSALEVEEEIVASDATTETIHATAPASGPSRFLRLEITAP